MSINCQKSKPFIKQRRNLYALLKTSAWVISRGCFTDDSKEMYQNENARKRRVQRAKRAEVVAFVHQTCRFVTSPLTYQRIKVTDKLRRVLQRKHHVEIEIRIRLSALWLFHVGQAKCTSAQCLTE